MDIQVDKYSLKNLQKINIILGKNGCGKSTLLKAVDQVLTAQAEYGSVKYITPERGGVLVYEANVEHNLQNDVNWMANTRRANQASQFRQQTVSQYRSLETQILRAVQDAYIAGDKGAATFDKIIQQINTLLDNIRIADSGGGPGAFKIYSKSSGDELNGNAISSGESELISLAIECLSFSRSVQAGKPNVLIMDEPDVHLHPDLQARLSRFLKQLAEGYDFMVLMATHSTSMLGDLASASAAGVALMRSGDETLEFRQVDDVYKKILPVFGAHPLSNIFNEAPLLLVEGDDDVRIWQQAIRSSNGKLSLYPVECGSIDNLNDHEKLAAEIVSSIYDSAAAYSLRDRDENPEDISDIPPVIRMRLHCRAAENLGLSDDALALAGTDWEAVKKRINEWLDSGQVHVKRAVMEKFRDEGFDRKGFKLKEIRLVLFGTIVETTKPWEVLVGQAIAQMKPSTNPHSLSTYLGTKVCENLLT